MLKILVISGFENDRFIPINLNDMTRKFQGFGLLALCLFFLSTAMAQVPTAEKLDPNMTLGEADADGIVWLDPRKEPFKLSGFEWIQED